MDKLKVICACPNCGGDIFTENEHDEYVCVSCKCEWDDGDLEIQPVYILG